MKTRLLLIITLCCSGAFAQDIGDFDRGPQTPTFYADETGVAKAMSACGPDKTKFDVTNPEKRLPAAVPEAGKALVYMIEEMPSYCGFACGMTIKAGLDGAWMGANHGNSYLSFSVTPGEHHLCVQWQSIFAHHSQYVALAGFTAEAGKTYYFRTRVLGVEKEGGYLDLDPINSDQGQFLVASYPLSISRTKR